MWDRIRHWWRAQGELAKLQGISDRMLADMGLTPEELRDRVLGREPRPEANRLCPPTAHIVRS
ncbi:MAG: DUF1127 domain-containing protein [Acetobacteraceae bacterium]|nr:MAG: DUF1127 domain-containing protein [Acetobacteraceae bacterium]